MALHLIFVREHSKVAEEVIDAFPWWNGKQIFDLTRHIVAAEMQAVTCHEFIPALTGSKIPRYQGYNPREEAVNSNRFTTVAFRVGHTLLNSTMASVTAGDVWTPHNLSLVLRNQTVFRNEGFDNFVRAMLLGHASEIDAGVVTEVRNLLRDESGNQSGRQARDLVSLNIQRGPDHEMICEFQ